MALAALCLAACAPAHRPLPPCEPCRTGEAASLFALPAALRQKPDGIPETPLRFEPPAPSIETLPNGLTLYLLEDHAVPLVHVRAIIRLGSLDEPETQTGLSAVLLAAMRAGGAGGLGPEALDDALERSAMLLESATSDELSELGLDLRAGDLQRGLALFFDVLRRPRLDPKAVESVLRRAKEGVRRRDDDPSDLASRALLRALWGAHSPFAREVSTASLDAIDRGDLVRLHARAVTPAATRLLVTGDFDPAAMRAEVSRLAAPWPRAPVLARAPLPVPAPRPRQVIVLARATAQAKVRIGQLCAARHAPEEEALRLLDAVMGGAPGASRLYNEIRDRRGLAYGVESSIAPGPGRGLLRVAADTRPEVTRELLEQALHILDGLRGEAPVQRAELALAKDAFVNSFAFRFDTAAKAAYERSLHDAFGYPVDYLARERERILAIAPEDVTAAARANVRPESLQIVVVGDPARLGDLSAFGPVRVVTSLQELTE
jgi:zinc protease